MNLQAAFDGFYSTSDEGWGESIGISGGGPYSVWQAPGMKHWHTVLDRNGVNVLERGTGEVFTEKETAQKICDKWNTEAGHLNG